MEDYTIEDIDKVENEGPIFEDEEMVDTDLTTIAPTAITFEDKRPFVRYPSNMYVFLANGGEPESFEEILEDENKIEWMDAIEDKMQSLYENNTSELVKFPKGKRMLKNKWIYRIKQNECTSQRRYKALLVVKGFKQRKSVDFDEIFASVMKMQSIQVVLGLAASIDLEVEQKDVKTTFLHGVLHE